MFQFSKFRLDFKNKVKQINTLIKVIFTLKYIIKNKIIIKPTINF